MRPFPPKFLAVNCVLELRRCVKVKGGEGTTGRKGKGARGGHWPVAKAEGRADNKEVTVAWLVISKDK